MCHQYLQPPSPSIDCLRCVLMCVRPMLVQAEDLRTLLRRYMEWAYQLFPNLAFEDFLPTLQKLSGKARVRRAIEDLREKQRQRYLVRAQPLLVPPRGVWAVHHRPLLIDYRGPWCSEPSLRNILRAWCRA